MSTATTCNKNTTTNTKHNTIIASTTTNINTIITATNTTSTIITNNTIKQYLNKTIIIIQ